jgi:hypothetical protein
VLVERVDVAHLAQGVLPLDNTLYPVVRYVRHHFRRIGRTAFFDLYRWDASGSHVTSVPSVWPMRRRINPLE